jgi:hypothetical protein
LSAPAFVDFSYKPDAPYLAVHVPAGDERKKLDQIACSLLNKRDK